MAQNEASSSSAATSTTSVSVPLSFKPSIILPPRSSVDNLFASSVGVSPGPMTLVSSFFSDNDPESECRSFSQLLAGAMASPLSVAAHKPAFTSCSPNLSGGMPFVERREDSFQFQRNSNSSFSDGQHPLFTIPPGLSPASLLDSPAFISRTQGSYGISHQQALAQVTAQATQTNYMHFQAECASSTSASVVTPIPDAHLVSVNTKSSQIAQKPNVTHMAVDRPADDGYNWRKYGQKLVKGSDFPRSYYKCTHPDCPVRKKVERSLDGQITEIIYKGQHNHQPPPPSKRSKDVGTLNGNSEYSENSELGFPGLNGKPNEVKEEVGGGYLPSTMEGSTDSGEVGDGETIKTEDNHEEGPALKRRNMENPVSEAIASHRSITEPRIIVQTTSEVDLLDDGYRWRKYGQKVVKGNLYPRSYYKCTSAGCNVRKHVERAATDPKAVVTTYEGKHNHDVPTNKRGSHSTSNYNSVELKPQSTVRNEHEFRNETVNVDARPLQMSAHLKIKEEEAL